MLVIHRIINPTTLHRASAHLPVYRLACIEINPEEFWVVRNDLQFLLALVKERACCAWGFKRYGNAGFRAADSKLRSFQEK